MLKPRLLMNSEVLRVMLRLPPAVSIILVRLWPRLMPFTAMLAARASLEFLS